jgi:hypothetical protein
MSVFRKKAHTVACSCHDLSQLSRKDGVMLATNRNSLRGLDHLVYWTVWSKSGIRILLVTEGVWMDSSKHGFRDRAPKEYFFYRSYRSKPYAGACASSFPPRRESVPQFGMADVTQHLPFPVINPPTTQVDIAVGSQTADPDRTIRVEHAKTYPVELWWFLAYLIFLVSFVNYIGLALGYYRDRRRRNQVVPTPSEPLTQEAPMRGSINLLRLPHALADTFRALSFRWTIPIGRSYTLNIAEVVLTAVYIAICFAWSLINSESLTQGRWSSWLTGNNGIATSKKGAKFDPHYYANIAGNIATIQFPLVVALGMKNNIISCELKPNQLTNLLIRGRKFWRESASTRWVTHESNHMAALLMKP